VEAQGGDHGVVSPDVVGCSGSIGHFGNANAANGKQVTADLALTGPANDNYRLTSATASTNANIAKRDVTASITVANKVYDGTDTATINTCSLEAQNGDHGVVSGDSVGCSGANGHFNDKNAANGKPVIHPEDPHIVAVASDVALPKTNLPVVDLNDIEAIADLLLKHAVPVSSAAATARGV
jgi:hypothetical protein